MGLGLLVDSLERNRSVLNRQAFCATHLHHRQTVGRTQLAQHVVNVIAHRLLCQSQLRRYFFISHPSTQQEHELLLSIGQAQVALYFEGRHLIPTAGHLLE